jgi:hypothetical protein
MNILQKLRAWVQRTGAPPDSDHELRITTPVAAPTDEAAAALVKALTQAVNASGAGRFDETEVIGDDSLLCLHFLGPSADALLDAVTPVLRAERWTHGAEIYQVYGNPMDPAAKEVIRTLTFDAGAST